MFNNDYYDQTYGKTYGSAPTRGRLQATMTSHRAYEHSERKRVTTPFMRVCKDVMNNINDASCGCSKQNCTFSHSPSEHRGRHIQFSELFKDYQSTFKKYAFFCVWLEMRASNKAKTHIYDTMEMYDYVLTIRLSIIKAPLEEQLKCLRVSLEKKEKEEKEKELENERIRQEENRKTALFHKKCGELMLSVREKSSEIQSSIDSLNRELVAVLCFDLDSKERQKALIEQSISELENKLSSANREIDRLLEEVSTEKKNFMNSGSIVKLTELTSSLSVKLSEQYSIVQSLFSEKKQINDEIRTLEMSIGFITQQKRILEQDITVMKKALSDAEKLIESLNRSQIWSGLPECKISVPALNYLAKNVEFVMPKPVEKKVEQKVEIQDDGQDDEQDDEQVDDEQVDDEQVDDEQVDNQRDGEQVDDQFDDSKSKFRDECSLYMEDAQNWVNLIKDHQISAASEYSSEFVGEGSYGKVYRVEKYIDNMPVVFAVKTSHHSSSTSSRDEALTRNAISSQTVVHGLVTVVEHNDNELYMRYYDNTLRKLQVSEEEGVRVFKIILWQLANGLRVLHHKGYLHKDIKPSNILVNYSHDGIVEAVLGDFGGVVESGHHAPSTDGYNASERKDGVCTESRRSDIYSLGVSMSEFVSRNDIDLPRDYVDILDRMTDEDFTRRPYASSLLDDIMRLEE